MEHNIKYKILSFIFAFVSFINVCFTQEKNNSIELSFGISRTELSTIFLTGRFANGFGYSVDFNHKFSKKFSYGINFNIDFHKFNTGKEIFLNYYYGENELISLANDNYEFYSGFYAAFIPKFKYQIINYKKSSLSFDAGIGLYINTDDYVSVKNQELTIYRHEIYLKDFYHILFLSLDYNYRISNQMYLGASLQDHVLSTELESKSLKFKCGLLF